MLGKADSAIRTMDYPLLAGAPSALMDLTSPAELLARVRVLEQEREDREQRFARQLESVRQEALEQGRAQAGGEQTAWRKLRTQELNAALEDFVARRDEYLSRVEQEVVKLALAIAERILHRETQMDPLLLAGAVRVALGQLAESTEVRLRVPAEQQEMWAEMLRLMPALPLRPQVVGDAEMAETEALLETTLGRVDLGVRAQIEEIERGFFDLLEVRANGTANGAGKQG